MAATIRDVAKLSGTSIAAVSAVLSANGRHNIRVGAATRERIHAAAAQLNFKPNPIARMLVTRKTGVLGLVFPYSRAFIDRNPFCAQVMSGVFEEVVLEKYNLMLHTAIGDDWSEAKDDALIDARVDGLILVIPPADSPVVARCLQDGFPFVTVVHDPPTPEACAVNAGEFEGGRLAARHLIALGHRRIAHLKGSPGIASTEPRACGFLAALEEAGIPVDPALVVPAGFDWKDGYEAMGRLLALPADCRPTALFAANDLCAHGALLRLQEKGLSVPEDMALIGYDDTWFAAMTHPPLTSVHMPIVEMGALAARILIALVEGREVEQRQPVLPVSLTVRQTCGASAPRASL